MKLTRTINLHGVIVHIDEDAYQLLKDYLADIENRLPADERKDVMEDLESRIAELLQSALFAQKSESATIEMVQEVRRRIGAPEEFGENKRPVFKREHLNRQGIGRVLTIILKAILIIIAIQLLFPVLAVLFALLMAFFGLTLGGMAIIPAMGFELMGGSTGWTWVLCLSVLMTVAMPIYMIVHWIVKYSRERRHPSLRFWLISLLIWLIALGGLVASTTKALHANGTDLITVLDKLDEMDEDQSLVKETRELEPFHAISMGGAIRAEIHVGDPQEVKVRYDNIMGNVVTEVKDGVLTLRGEGDHSAKVVISVPSLDELNMTGACKVDIDGAVENLRADISGASRLDAEDLSVQDLHINVSGASKAEMSVTGTLWAQASGASKIIYHGDPQVSQRLCIGASCIQQN